MELVPGVEKCGPKTAVKWLEAYGMLAGVMEHASEIKGKVGENLRAALPRLPLSYDLVTIKTDVTCTPSFQTASKACAVPRRNGRNWLSISNAGLPHLAERSGIHSMNRLTDDYVRQRQHR